MALANLVRVVSATTGTGTLTLGAAVTGFLTPSQAGMTDGVTYSYAIEADYVTVGDDSVPTSREVGTGTYSSGAGTLTRSVINSTNSNALLSLAGDEQVIVTGLAQDFYQEGTFTPQLQFGAANVGMTTSTATGQYSKIGNLVVFSLVIVLTAKGSSTGIATVAALPYTATSSLGNAICPATINLGASTIATMCSAVVVNSTSVAALQRMAAGALTNLTEADLNSNSIIRVSGSYQVV